MVLYHGSNQSVTVPRLVTQNRNLDFVHENRMGIYSGEKYDIIIGPVANDTVYQTFTLYESGVLTKQQTIEALKVRKLFNQYVFATDAALALLKFVRVEEVR